jgi:FkbM family methyltransferase
MRAINRIFLKKLLTHWSHYTAQLPYNLNWAIDLQAPEKAWLEKRSLVVCDVGARGGAPDELVSFYPFMTYHAFDADEKECARFNASPHPYHSLRVFPLFIGGAEGRTQFNLYQEPGQSSVYQPALRYKELFGGKEFGISGQCSVQTTTLDAVYKNLPPPDFIKLDTQGSELDILRGAPAVLKTTTLVEAEVEFIPAYEGQPLFHQVFEFMLDHGFELLYLNRQMGQRKQIFNGPCRGQLVFGDALFGKREDRMQDYDTERLVKSVLLLINYGHLDVAFHVTKTHPQILQELPSLARHLRRDSYGSLFRRGLLSQFDKLLLLPMRLRKTNQISMDSDRSWPIL